MITMAKVGRAAALSIATAMAAAVLTGCGERAANSPLGASSRSGSDPVIKPSRLSHGGPVLDHVSFVDRLRGDGVRVDVLGTVQRHGIRPRGTRLRLTGGGLAGPVVIESYNYDAIDLSADPTRALRADAARIRTDGRLVFGRTVGGRPGYWFRAERLLVEYVGSDWSIVGLLGRVIGPPFAGARGR